MRLPILLLGLALQAPLAAQSVVVAGGPARLDSVSAWATLEDGRARVTVRHVIRGRPATHGALFVSLPAGATLAHVSVYEATRIVSYNSHSPPDASRQRWAAVPRAQRGTAHARFGREGLVHVPLPFPADGRLMVQVYYHQPLVPAADGRTEFRYPAGMAPAPGGFGFGMEVTTAHGFRVPPEVSHPASVDWGEEMGPCPPTARCGTMNVPSRRVMVVRLRPGAVTEDIRVAYTPAGPGEVDLSVAAGEDSR